MRGFQLTNNKSRRAKNLIKHGVAELVEEKRKADIPSEENLSKKSVETNRWIIWCEEELEGELARVPCALWETDHWGSASATDPKNWTDRGE